MSPNKRLTRFEALMPVVLAAGGAILLRTGNGTEPWMWGILAIVAIAGLTGLVLPTRGDLVFVRSVVVLVAAVLLAATTDGTSSPFRFWFAGAVVAYPLVLPARWTVTYPAMTAGLYAALALVPGAKEPLAEVAAWSLLMLLVGLVVAVLGHTSSQLATERAIATEQMQLARVRLEAAFAAASSGMALIAESGSLVRVNSALCELLGRTEAELMDTNWRALIVESDVAELESAVDRLLSGTMPSFQMEVRLLGADGGIRWVLLGASVVDREADERQLFIHAQDVTQRVLAARRLSESEEHFRNLFGRSPVATWEQDFSRVAPWVERILAGGVQDLRGYLQDRPAKLREAIDLIEVRDANDAAAALVEADTREELLGALSPDSYMGTSPETLIEQLVAISQGRDRAEVGFTGRTLGGSAIDGIVHWATPQVNGVLQLSKVVVTITDITEFRRTRAELIRAEERLRTVISAAPIILFATDAYGVFTLAVGEGLAELGLKAGVPVGRSVFEMFRDSPGFLKAVRRAVAGESFTTTVEIRDRVFDIRLSAIIESGKVTGAIGVASDITVRKQTAERLEELIKSKDEFVASVSHELRTPLTAVVGFATELRDNSANLTAEDTAAYIDLIASQAMEVADLVEDLLVAARVDMDTVSVFPEPLDVWTQVSGVIASWTDELAARVTTEGPEVKAFADPIRFRQILRNLLSNALRYGGTVISVTAARVDENVVVKVRDNGLGIPERDREGIFDPYRRAHEGGGQPLSVGLGLTVSRQLARLMDGELEYRYVDDWSEFVLTIPAVL